MHDIHLRFEGAVIMLTVSHRLQGSDRPFWSVYELYNWKFDGWRLEGVQWSAMPRQLPSLVALFLVVTFGSALDVAAIQQDTPWPLDFNQELVTVGATCCCHLHAAGRA